MGRVSTLRQTAFPRRVLAGLWTALGLASLAHAQVDRASLKGTVTDPSGRVLPEVHITASQDATGLRRAATSSGNGSYAITEMPVGVYTVTFGRNWATLTALAPGAIDAGGSNQRTVRFAGRGLDDNNFTEDGIDATNIVNQAQQPFVRLAIPTDTIQEFRVESMLFTAESGSTPGGQLAVTTATGTNQFHGDIFDFLRKFLPQLRIPHLAYGTRQFPQPGISCAGGCCHPRQG